MDLAALVREPDLDPDMRAMAEAELAAVEDEADEMSKAIRIALLPKDAADEGSAILEVRAGTGRRRGGFVRWRLVSHVRQIRRAKALEG